MYGSKQYIERILSAKSKRNMFFLFDSTTSLCHSMDYLFPQGKKKKKHYGCYFMWMERTPYKLTELDSRLKEA